MPHLVRTLRIQRGWTVPDFAQRSDISVKIAYELEKNPQYNMKWTNMKKVSNAFGLPTSVIFFPEEELDKRAMMAMIFQHTVSVLRNLGAIREDKLTSTPPPVDRPPREQRPLDTPASRVLAEVAPSQEAVCV